MIWCIVPVQQAGSADDDDEQRGLRRASERGRRRDQGPRGSEVRCPVRQRHRRDQDEPRRHQGEPSHHPVDVRLHACVRCRAHLASVPVADARRRLLIADAREGKHPMRGVRRRILAPVQTLARTLAMTAPAVRPHPEPIAPQRTSLRSGTPLTPCTPYTMLLRRLGAEAENVADKKTIARETLKHLLIPGYSISKMVQRSVKEADAASDSTDLEALQIVEARQELKMRMAERQAKAMQELAIAHRIQTAEQVEIEEYYDYSGEGLVEVGTTAETLGFAASGKGSRVVRRICRFTGVEEARDEIAFEQLADFDQEP